MKTLYLQGNKLERLEYGLFNGLTNLREIWLESNSIISIDRNIFVGLNKLEKICLAKNPMSSTFPNSINSLCDSNPKCIIKINERCIKNNDLTKFELLANMTGSNYGGIYALAILSNDLIASGSGDTTIKVWNSTTFQLVATLKGHTNYVFSLAVLPNGNLVSGGWDTMIKVWNLTTFELITNLDEGNTGSVNSLAIMLNENIISNIQILQ